MADNFFSTDEVLWGPARAYIDLTPTRSDVAIYTEKTNSAIVRLCVSKGVPFSSIPVDVNGATTSTDLKEYGQLFWVMRFCKDKTKTAFNDSQPDKYALKARENENDIADLVATITAGSIMGDLGSGAINTNAINLVSVVRFQRA